MGWRIRKVKVRKFMGWDKDSLTGKAKAAHTSKAGIDSPLPMVRQVFSHPQESRAPPHVMVTWEDKLQHFVHLSFSSFSSLQLCMLSMMPYVMGYTSASWGQLSHSSHNILCSPSPLSGGVGGRKGPDSVSALLSNNKTSLWYQHTFGHKPKP